MSSYMKLVIADDEPNIRDSLSQLFPWEELGIQVVFLAANGREVLDYMEMNPVDLLLADIRMPVMDGLELTQAVRRTYPEVPVILLSAFADFEYARTALRFGVSAYLTKPVNYGEPSGRWPIPPFPRKALPAPRRKPRATASPCPTRAITTRS